MFNYEWKIENGYPGNGTKANNLKVFSTFACGGGSSMGYKLAGFTVIGANDIDPQMEKVYKANHNPNIYLRCPIGDLISMELPKELYNLDILDGSPPCSTFSVAGLREKSWKKNKKFKEGQAKQVLSDLFFDWIKLVDKLQPKIAIAENVKGMIMGNAKAYTQTIVKKLEDIGYDVQLFLLNSGNMGVPQKRERVFFICRRRNLNFNKLKLSFNEKSIILSEVIKKVKIPIGKVLSPAYSKWWFAMGEKSGSFGKTHPKGSFFNTVKCNPFKVINTIIATTGAKLTHWNYPNELSNEVLGLCGSYPTDYKYLDLDPKYLIGMSVPPVMVAQIAHQIYVQWFKLG